MNTACKTKEWDVQLKKKRVSHFKAGSELADKVNKMNVDINEQQDENSVTTDIEIDVEQNENELLKVWLKKKRKTRMKAGADLTDKVNLVNIDLTEELSEAAQSCKLKMEFESEDNGGFELNLRKRDTRFKASADLTEKVNMVDVDWTEDLSDESEMLTVSIKVVSTICPALVLEKAEVEK